MLSWDEMKSFLCESTKKDHIANDWWKEGGRYPMELVEVRESKPGHQLSKKNKRSHANDL